MLCIPHVSAIPSSGALYVLYTSCFAQITRRSQIDYKSVRKPISLWAARLNRGRPHPQPFLSVAGCARGPGLLPSVLSLCWSFREHHLAEARGEFSLDGSLLTYEAKIDMSEVLAQKTAQYCAAISLMFNTLASSFAERSGMNWVPQHGWADSGGEWTACIGDGGRRRVFVETSKADFNRLFEALGDER